MRHSTDGVLNPAANGDSADEDAWPLECPVCTQSLKRQSGTLVCPSGHSFDIAREGYVNLMPPQHRPRGIAGDTSTMLAARRRFLEGGAYRPVLDALARSVEDELQRTDGGSTRLGSRACVLEVGCGEGYYVGNLASMLGGPAVSFIGADVSKAAAKLAAKRYQDAAFLVADTNRRLYLHDESVAVLLDVFAPRNPAEFGRVVKPGGAALIVVPSPSHLGSLRSELGLLGIEEDKEARVLEQFSDAFDLEDRREIEYPLDLSAAAVRDLVGMGPNAWHTETHAEDCASGAKTVASFVIMHLRRAGAHSG